MPKPARDPQRLAQELEASFRNRADLYRLIYDELRAALGEAEAEALLVRAVEKRGREVARTAFAGYRPDQAVEIGEAFLAVSPDGGRMYPTEVKHGDDRITFKVLRCPLKDAWLAAGVDEKHLATLCRIAGAFDRGLFEATGIQFSNHTWQPGDGSRCCIIELRNAE